MVTIGFNMSPLGVFSGRFETKKILMRDPGFVRALVLDVKANQEAQVQFLSAPDLQNDRQIQFQWEALQVIKEKSWFRPQECLCEEDQALMVGWSPPGRTLFQLNEIQAEDTYLSWLGEALRDLHELHQQSFLHLAQNELSWLLFQPDGKEAKESLGLSDPGLFADLHFGNRVQVSILKAVAPEILNGEIPDERADLYSLACLIVLQRFPLQWEGLKSLSQWIDAHRGGRFIEAVPKTDSPLNHWLRSMLAVDREERPPHAAHVLRALFPQEQFATAPTERPHWAQQRILRRQANLVLSTLQTLICEGESVYAFSWLEEIASHLPGRSEPYLHYLRALAHRKKRNFVQAKEFLEKAVAALPERQDKKLKALLLLEEARGLNFSNERARILEQLDSAWALAEQFPDLDLQSQILAERGAYFRKIGRIEKALDDLCFAERSTLGLRDFPARGEILQELADLLGQYGFFHAALPLAEEALKETESEPEKKARRHVELGLILSRLGRFGESHAHFREAKYQFSVLKDLPGLVWATAHQIRGWMAETEWVKARKELKALRNRAQELNQLHPFLDWLELELWLQGGERLQPDCEPLLCRIRQAESTAEESIFLELLWSSAQTLETLAELHRRDGNDELAENSANRARVLRVNADTALTQKGYQKEVTPLSPFPEPVAVEEPISSIETQSVENLIPENLQADWQKMENLSKSLQEENRRLRERIHLMERELDFLRHQKFVAPSGTAPEMTQVMTQSLENSADLSRVKEETEKRSIEEALRRHRGNRNLTAQELGIHRRTLFEKLKKYGLENLTFDPSEEEIRRALEQAKGKRNLAAEMLGMSRSSFYRRLKELGIL